MDTLYHNIHRLAILLVISVVFDRISKSFWGCFSEANLNELAGFSEYKFRRDLIVMPGA